MGKDMITMLLVAFLLLEIVDIGFTIYGQQQGFTELNPILAKLMHKVGLYPGLAITKIPVMAGAIYFVVVEGAGLTFLLLLVVPFALLALFNLYQVLKFRRGS